MVIYNPRRSTERLQELIVDLSSTSKKKTSETLDRGSKVYQQGQNAINREFQGVQEAINTLQTNHNTVTKNRADIFDAHQKDNEYVQALVNKNVEREIKNIAARAQTELKNSESWRKIIGIGTGYALQQAQKEKAEVKEQAKGIVSTGRFNTVESFQAIERVFTEKIRNENEQRQIYKEAGLQPDQIELLVGKSAATLRAIHEQNAISYAADLTTKIASGSSELVHRNIIPTTGGSATSYSKLHQQLTTDPNYKTPEGYKLASSKLGSAQSALLREAAKDFGNDKLFNKFISPALSTYFQKSAVTSLKPLLKDVEAKQKEIAFARDFSTIHELFKYSEGFSVSKTLEKISAHWWDTKPPNVSAKDWAMKYATDIMSFGINSGKVTRHQARMHLKHTVLDRTTKTKMTWDKKVPKAAEAIHETLKASRLKASQIAAAEAKNKRDLEKGLVEEGVERIQDRMFDEGIENFDFNDVQLITNEMLRSNNYSPDVVAAIKQRMYLGPTSAPMIAGKEFKQSALDIINNPNRKLTFDWILDNGKHVPPSIKNEVIELWRKNGGNGPKEGVRGYHQVKEAHKNLDKKFKGLGGAKWLSDKTIDYTVGDGLAHAKQQYDEDLIEEWTNNGGDWIKAHRVAYKNFTDELAKGEKSIYHVEKDSKGRKWMPYFDTKISAAKESNDHVGDYAALYKEEGISAMQSPKFEPIDANTLNKMAYQWNNGLPMTWPPVLDKLKRQLPGVYENEGQILADLVIGHNARNPIGVSTTPQITLNNNPRFDELNSARQGVESTVTTPAAPTNQTITIGNVGLGQDWSIRNIEALGKSNYYAPWVPGILDFLEERRKMEANVA